MNRYFFAGEERKGFPRRALARIDDIAPIDPEAGGPLSLSLDAVDAEWSGFAEGNLLSLTPDANDFRLSRYWKSRFLGPPGEMLDARPYDEVPLFQIDVEMPDIPLLSQFLRGFTGWLEIELSAMPGVPVDVYGGLFAEPARAHLVSAKVVAPDLSRRLDQAFDMALWPDAEEDALRAALKPRCSIDQLAVIDIGQGSANALLCSCGIAVAYFDLGCGVYRNRKTNPATIQFCNCDSPVVMLSHWDSDHWGGAAIDRAMLAAHWIAPRQIIGPKHVAFADSILAAGGIIDIFPAHLPALSVPGRQVVELRRCIGPPSDRNGSGLALFVEDIASGRHWLLTGDAAYDQLAGPMPADLAALVVPHHGADMGKSGIPPSAPIGETYSRLLYSFGPGNAHGKTAVQHPTQAAVNAHVAAGWSHSGWSAPPPGMTDPLLPVIATAEHPATHNGGARVGWTGQPACPPHLAICPKPMPLGQI